MTDTDPAPEPPLGVGESINERAEDVARRAEERAGRKGAADRPYAADTGKDARGVHPSRRSPRAARTSRRAIRAAERGALRAREHFRGLWHLTVLTCAQRTRRPGRGLMPPSLQRHPGGHEHPRGPRASSPARTRSSRTALTKTPPDRATVRHPVLAGEPGHGGDRRVREPVVEAGGDPARRDAGRQVLDDRGRPARRRAGRRRR